MTIEIYWQLKFFDDEKEIDMNSITDEDFTNLKRIIVKKVIEELEIMKIKGVVMSGSTMENAEQI